MVPYSQSQRLGMVHAVRAKADGRGAYLSVGLHSCTCVWVRHSRGHGYFCVLVCRIRWILVVHALGMCDGTHRSLSSTQFPTEPTSDPASAVDIGRGRWVNGRMCFLTIGMPGACIDLPVLFLTASTRFPIVPGTHPSNGCWVRCHRTSRT